MNALYVLSCAVVIGTMIGCEGAPDTVRGEAPHPPCFPRCNENEPLVKKLCPGRCLCMPRGDARHTCMYKWEAANIWGNSEFLEDDFGNIRRKDEYYDEDEP